MHKKNGTTAGISHSYGNEIAIGKFVLRETFEENICSNGVCAANCKHRYRCAVDCVTSVNKAQLGQSQMILARKPLQDDGIQDSWQNG